MKDRFDLENELMGCWHVVDDLDVLISHLDDPFFLGMKGDHADRLANALIGMKTLYDIKFNVMMDTFADCIQELEPPVKRPSPLDKAEFDWGTRTSNSESIMIFEDRLEEDSLGGINSITPAEWDAIR
jgi:hypothetical protein